MTEIRMWEVTKTFDKSRRMYESKYVPGEEE